MLLDVVHSHAVKNTAEGLNEFDGTVYQFFHEGGRGEHPAWGTKLFNYGKNEVIHFLLSNLKYYLTEFRFDGLLHYGELLEFDRAMVKLAKEHGIFSDFAKCLFIDADCQVLNYSRGDVVFALNFSPTNSYEGYYVTVPRQGNYRVIMSSDEGCFGGFDRIALDYIYKAEEQPDGAYKIRMYLPLRCAACIVRVGK